MVNDPVHTNHFFGDEPTIIENDGVTNSPNVVKFEVQVMLTILIASLTIAFRSS
jgi:5'-AMP-activated protein kinase catalytic alpha subunit